MTTHTSRHPGARRFRGTVALALVPALLSLTLLLGACGQMGPLRHPWETTQDARDNAASRRVPTGTRADLPSAVDDASSTQVRP